MSLKRGRDDALCLNRIATLSPNCNIHRPESYLALSFLKAILMAKPTSKKKYKVCNNIVSKNCSTVVSNIECNKQPCKTSSLLNHFEAILQKNNSLMKALPTLNSNTSTASTRIHQCTFILKVHTTPILLSNYGNHCRVHNQLSINTGWQ
jgi:hypothetical protein